MAERLDKATFGENGFAFVLGPSGFFFIDGPSGQAGHAANASGYDGLAYNPALDELWIIDNKAYASTGNVSSASAIDPAKNLAKNLEPKIAQVELMAGLPKADRILELMNSARQDLALGRNLRSNIKLVVSNFGGRSTGITAQLRARGIVFMDTNVLPKTPQPITPGTIGKMTAKAMRRRRVSGPAAAGALDGMAAAAAYVSMKGQENAIALSIDRAIAARQKEIAAIFAHGLGCLVIITVSVNEGADLSNRLLQSIVLREGVTESEAIMKWEGQSQLRQGSPQHIKLTTEYRWLPCPVSK